MLVHKTHSFIHRICHYDGHEKQLFFAIITITLYEDQLENVFMKHYAPNW